MYDFGNTDETELNSFSVNIGALKFLANDYNDVKVFLKAVSQYTDENHKYSRKSNIVISTIHSSKGLEFDNVIILDAINGILPQTEELNALQGDKEEDSRLFYVGVTRAKNKVEFIVPKTLFGIRVVPSMFIGRLGTDVVFPNLNKSTTDDNNFAISKRIKHAVFGEGTIIEIKDDVLVIAFDSGKTKQILSNFCKPI
jgi:DNA helicase-2/ATP-dependent DNA helicase PcrA